MGLTTRHGWRWADIIIAYPNLNEWHTVVNDAVTAWKTLVSSSGIPLPLVPTPGATCAGADGHCVEIGDNVIACPANLGEPW